MSLLTEMMAWPTRSAAPLALLAMWNSITRLQTACPWGTSRIRPVTSLNLPSTRLPRSARRREIPDDLRYSLTDAPGAGSYPIVGTCWAVVRTSPPDERRTEVARFLRWVTTEGQSDLAGLHYGRLPNEFSGQIEALLNKISVGK